MLLPLGYRAAITTGVHVSFQIEFSSFLNIGPGVGLLDHMIALFLMFCSISILFFKVVAPIDTPTNSVGGGVSLCLTKMSGYIRTFLQVQDPSTFPQPFSALEPSSLTLLHLDLWVPPSCAFQSDAAQWYPPLRVSGTLWGC